LCPADRYFEIHSALKKTIEKGIEENVLEMALRGKPKSPFYMVGRMGQQSVVIRAEKGKVKMTVDGKDPSDEQELEYQIEKGADHGGEETQGPISEEREKGAAAGTGSMSGGAFSVVRAPQTVSGLPEPGHPVDGAAELGAASVRGDDASASTEAEKGAGSHAVGAPGQAFEEERSERRGTGGPFGETVSEDTGIEVEQEGASDFEPGGKKERLEDEPEEEQEKAGSDAGAPTGGGDPAGAGRKADGKGGGQSPGGIEEGPGR